MRADPRRPNSASACATNTTTGARPSAPQAWKFNNPITNHPITFSMERHAMHLSKQQLLDYERDGFIILPNLVSNDEVEILRAELDRLAQIDCSYTRRGRTGAIAT